MSLSSLEEVQNIVHNLKNKKSGLMLGRDPYTNTYQGRLVSIKNAVDPVGLNVNGCKKTTNFAKVWRNLIPKKVFQIK